MEAYFNLLREQNPEMAKYIDMLQPMMDNKSVEENVSAVDPEIEKKIEKLTRINRRLFSIIEGLKTQLESELLQNDDLAKAIGACKECFGENKECPECFGSGKSGTNVPDFILYNKYVSPAIQRYNKHYFNKN
ncbi:hypothetical protein FEDK69T_22930 [Flavobacterium enshiense DK69]|uniref:Uncharacterized protein n=1 Tax=Flavobacterium enshiense DK69 TaxID=1107311 RepID=V6SD29_9FLAO|nr:hypothetical protein [Flavobacterium enshiense]ESU22310.1 hypothetical protein FEDK69T_22930 [Flavobacterium enshiense DK69]KGO97314.1 hypothetical protein Q767_01560 [Flavobacterium enshiense DK69]